MDGQIENAEDIDYENSISPLESYKGKTFLDNAVAQKLCQYHDLISFYQHQEHGAFCALASIGTAYDFMSGKKLLSQTKLWQVLVEENHFKESKLKYGLSIVQASELARTVGLDVKLYSNTDLTFIQEKLECSLEAALPTSSSVVVINFWRNFKEHRGGHFSPVVAYDKQRRQVLIMDTNNKRSFPHWISLDLLIFLLCKVDRTSGCPRGFLVLSNVN